MGPFDIPGYENAAHRYDMGYDDAEDLKDDDQTEDDIPGEEEEVS